RKKAAGLRNDPSDREPPTAIESMRQPMAPYGMQPGVGEDDLEPASRGRVIIENGLNIGSHPFKHHASLFSLPVSRLALSLAEKVKPPLLISLVFAVCNKYCLQKKSVSAALAAEKLNARFHSASDVRPDSRCLPAGRTVFRFLHPSWRP